MNMLLINLIGWFLCSMTNMKDHSTEIGQMKMTHKVVMASGQMGTGREGPLKFHGTFAATEKNNGGTFDFWAAQFLQKNSDLWPVLGRKTSGATCSTIFSSLSFKDCNDRSFKLLVNNFPVKQRMLMVWYVLITKVLADDFCAWVLPFPEKRKWKMRKIFREGKYLVCQTPVKTSWA